MKSPTDKALAKMFRAPLVEWDKLAWPISSGDKLTISRAAENDAERLVLLAEYLDALANGSIHASAVKQANKRVAKVRKSLGYSYPKQGLAGVSF